MGQSEVYLCSVCNPSSWWRTLQVNALIALQGSLPVALSCNHIAASWSWFLFVSMLLFGNLGSSFLCCLSLPSNLCAHMNATAFLLHWSKPWTDADLNIVPSLAVCDSAAGFSSVLQSISAWSAPVFLVKTCVGTGMDHHGLLCQVFVSPGCTLLGWSFSSGPSGRLRAVRFLSAGRHHFVSNQLRESVNQDIARVVQQSICKVLSSSH